MSASEMRGETIFLSDSGCFRPDVRPRKGGCEFVRCLLSEIVHQSLSHSKNTLGAQCTVLVYAQCAISVPSVHCQCTSSIH